MGTEAAACKLSSGLKRMKESEKATYQNEREYKSLPLPTETIGTLTELLPLDDFAKASPLSAPVTLQKWVKVVFAFIALTFSNIMPKPIQISI